ncbi:MAG TPA: energy transducer TonB [Pyrinomonadaceae bacterium]|nr:energy transducer TonB [Pyrinomonadaceae bacterium]
MFSNLIESGSHAGDLKRKGRFFLATTAFYGLLLAAAGVGSVYAYNAGLDYNPEYELISMMRFPPAEARSEEPRREERRAASSPARADQVAMRIEASMVTPYKGEKIANAHTPVVRTNQAFVLGPRNFTPEEPGGPVGPSHPGGPRHGAGNNAGPTVTEPGETPPPPASAPPPARPPQPPPPVEGPVRLTSSLITSKAIDKPAPPYPPIAKVANIQGTVAVQIVIDEQGRVVSAKATNGPPLLLNAAVQAAYRARFTPTVLGGRAVKVTGSISYNFVLR